MSIDTEKRNFLGIPVEGEINHGGHHVVEQKTKEDLAELLNPILSNPLFKSVGWVQYTPYFNDGDPCVFSVNEPYFVCVGEDVNEEDEDYDPWEFKENHGVEWGEHPVLGKEGSHYDRGVGQWVKEPYEGEHEPEFRLAKAFSDAIQSGAFDNVLLDAFGDHADITVKPTGITVEYYSHD